MNGIRAGFCVFASLVTAALPAAATMADPQADEIEQLALDYLENGANDPTSSQAVGEAGIDFAVGMISLGVASLGVPGAGGVIAVLSGLFSSDSASVPPVVDRRLTALETNVKTLQANIKALAANIAKNDNLDRLSGLEPISANIGRDSRSLSEVPQMSQVQKTNLVKNALEDANRLLPTKSAVAASLWEWTNVRVRGNPQSSAVSTTTETVDNLNLALPLYLQSIAVLAAAIDATGVNPQPEELRPHLYFLGAEFPDGRPLDPVDGLTPLPELADDISCAAIAPAQPSANDMCDMPVRCTSPVTAVSGTVQFPRHGITGCTVWDPSAHGYRSRRSAPSDSYYRGLVAEAKKNISPVRELIAKAARALGAAGQVAQAFEMTFYDADWLYAVDGEGRLFKFTHQTVTRPFQEGGKPKPWSGIRVDADRLDRARRILESATQNDNGPTVAAKAAPGTSLAKQSALWPAVAAHAAKQPPVSHDLSRAKLERGDWGAFASVIVSESVDSGLIVYGLKRNGDLIWRRIGGVVNGLDAPAAPLEETPQRVGSAWNTLKNVFSTGEGVLYGVASNGDLIWYRHRNNEDGNAAPQWDHHPVGLGWGAFTRLFSPGEGVIYAVKPDGTLLWYKHHGYLTGAGVDQPGAWEGPKKVGSGWQGFEQIVAARSGHIYAVNAAGELLYYNHKGWRTGDFDWDAAIEIGDGWGDYRVVFAAMGRKPGGPVLH